MLKADLHIHTHEDPNDGYKIKYSAKEFITVASKMGYDIIAITNHDAVYYNDEIAEFARRKGILLIPAIERTVEGKHVLIYNITKEEAEKIKTFEDLRKFKNKDNLIIAAHPYFLISSLGKKFLENIDIFDAVEYSFFFTRIINFNRKAVKIAKKYGKPVVGTSDLHNMKYFGFNYTLIDSQKHIPFIIKAIKKNKIELKVKHLSPFYFIRAGFGVFSGPIRRRLHRK